DRATLDIDVVQVDDAGLVGAVTEFVSGTFDVTREVPVRARIVELSDTEHVLVFVVHHIAGDGSSMGPLMRDLMVAYTAHTAGESPSWKPLPVQYADYAIWQRAVLGDEADPDSLISRQIDHWRTALSDVPAVLDLPTDRPRPAVQSFAGGRVDVSIAAETHRGLTRLAAQTNTTLFMVVHAAWAVLLSRLSGADDVTVGTPIAGRGEEALDDLIGQFVNTLVLRSRVDGGEAFTGLLRRTRESDLAAFANADVPFERLVEVLDPVRSTAHHPLFQVGLSFQNLDHGVFELPGLTLSGVDFEAGISQFDLHLIVADAYDENGEPLGLGGGLTFASALFDEATATAIVDRFTRVLDAIVSDPEVAVGDIDILDVSERAALGAAGAGRSVSVPAVTLPDLFAEQVGARGAATAVVTDDAV
ncbi:condensation domain-containing protein, partial [Rhodococcus yananensis]|uniref:condensation domain-containing protein n=1 Tax=Rhodococcus yananensis TaxID=2879464 RepID=UPI003EBF2374